MKQSLMAVALGVAAGLTLVACNTLLPGADPFVVRVEQTLTVANGTFDFVLHFDQADRGFWRTNAPAFHEFCEWLRTPLAYGTNSEPRAVVMQLNVNNLKHAYKASKTTGTSNALWYAWSTLNTVIGQSSSWSNIVVTPTHP